MNRSLKLLLLAVFSFVLCQSTNGLATNPWIANVNWGAVANQADQSLEVTFTVGEGHVVIDFSGAEKGRGLTTHFIDPLDGKVDKELGQPLYDMSTKNELDGCLRGCDRVVDPDEHDYCLDYCYKKYGQKNFVRNQIERGSQ